MVLSTFFAHAFELLLAKNHRTSAWSDPFMPLLPRVPWPSPVYLSPSDLLSVAARALSPQLVYRSAACVSRLRENLAFALKKVIYGHPKRRSSTLDHQLARTSARATKCFDMPVCQPSACTFCSALHDGHGVLHHVSGATGATVRSMSPRSSFLRALCIPWQTPLVGPLGSSERTTFCQYTTDNSHRENTRRHVEIIRNPGGAGYRPSGILRSKNGA